MLPRSQRRHRDTPSPEVGEGPDPIGPEYLVAAHVSPRQNEDWIPGIDPHREWPYEVHTKVGAVRRKGIRSPSLCRNMANLRKPFTREQVLGQIQGSEAEGLCAHESESCRLGRRLGGD